MFRHRKNIVINPPRVQGTLWKKKQNGWNRQWMSKHTEILSSGHHMDVRYMNSQQCDYLHKTCPR